MKRGWMAAAALFLVVATLSTTIFAADEKSSGEFVVVSVEGNIVKAKNKGTGTRLPLTVTDKTVIKQKDQKKGIGDIKKGDEFFGEYAITPDNKYLATMINLK